MTISKYHRFMQFTRTASVLDMRGDEETRKVRAARFERKNKTGRKGRAVYTSNGRPIVIDKEHNADCRLLHELLGSNWSRHGQVGLVPFAREFQTGAFA